MNEHFAIVIEYRLDVPYGTVKLNYLAIQYLQTLYTVQYCMKGKGEEEGGMQVEGVGREKGGMLVDGDGGWVY